MAGDMVYIALGSNEGDRFVNLCAALDQLAATPGVVLHPARDVASLYETFPVGGPAGQGAYLNTCARLQSGLTPRSLLAAMQAVEASLGRMRRQRWGPRTIDVDLLLHGDTIMDAEFLTLPHPRLIERRFVLDPLEELAGTFVHPILGEPIAAIAARVRREQPYGVVRIVAPRGWYAERLSRIP